MGFKQTCIVAAEKSLPVKYKLFVKLTLKVLETEQVLIAVEVARKPETGCKPVVLKKIEYAEACQKVNARIKIGCSSVEYLVGVV